ncbi:MAG: hypothetical protein IKJ56_02490 [Bacteroidales bacterium]|nr:hypothetical protein [Bacteroidales bacterium]
MKFVRNIVAKEIIDAIPSSVQLRRIFIKKQLSPLKDCEVFCGSLGVYVKIENKSINEIAENASVSANSTIAALNLLNLVRNAEFEKFYLPTSNTQVKKIGAVFIISLKANLIGYGNAKVLVAATEYRGALYYSVTVPP